MTMRTSIHSQCAVAAIVVAIMAAGDASARVGGGRLNPTGARASGRGPHGRGTIRYSNRPQPAAAPRAAAPAQRPVNYGSVYHGRVAAAPVRQSTVARSVAWRDAPAVRPSDAASGGAIVVRGPYDRRRSVVETPQGDAVAVRGPRAGGAAAVRTPEGAAAVVRGPQGRRAVAVLPDDHVRVSVGGRPYYSWGSVYYERCFYDGQIMYVEVAPPVGVVVETLPPEATTRVIGGTTYYYVGETCYAATEKDGKRVYEVVEPPAGSEPEPASSDPFELLRRMSDHIAQLKHFRIGAKETLDEVLESGEKVALSSYRSLDVSRPDKLLSDVKGGPGSRRVWYDGKKLSMLDRAPNVYTTVETPDTIDGMLEMVAERFHVTLPLADLLYSDSYERLVAGEPTGEYVGLHQVDDHTCHHLAFTQDNIDWQIWIEAGDAPWPRKILITYTQLPGQPRYSVTLPHWEVVDGFEPGHFDFRPPDGAEQVRMLPAASRGRATAAVATQPAS